MKILLDLQACQSNGSRNRGIGRYSLALAKAMIEVAPEHEFWILLNAAFPETVSPLKNEFSGLLDAGRIVVFQAPAGSAEFGVGSAWRTRAAELLRAHTIDAIEPDVVHVASMFEGQMDDCVVDIESSASRIPVAVTLYDLIPLIYAERYLAYERTRSWYLRKLDALARADLLLGISAATCTEASAHLSPGPRRIVNISAAADPMFSPDAGMALSTRPTLQRLGIDRSFVMYTGGIDWRKNLEGLIRAYALLPASLRASHQLAIVCHAEAHDLTRLRSTAKSVGLHADELVLTGFISNDDLIVLYRACELFVFPSLHEGFGLPALEAMRCGAPVIGSNTSSLPEVIGRPDALFDPRSDRSISELMQRGLQDEEFRKSLKDHAAIWSAQFSWHQTASLAVSALEALCATREASARFGQSHKVLGRKPRLAMVSPVPPARTGIANYCAELLPSLSRHYEIELITSQVQVDLPPEVAGMPVRSVDWFRKHADNFDRVIYQFGNSEFHKHMFSLLNEHPGVVVLHDFFLSSALNWMEITGFQPNALHDALLGSHGAEALQFDREHGREATLLKYPASQLVTGRATGVIVHSDLVMKMADRWYGEGTSSSWRMIRHLREAPKRHDRARAREQLGLKPDDYLVCSFGHLSASKLNLRLLDAWSLSRLAKRSNCHLVFVGEISPHPYGAEVAAKVRTLSKSSHISITGYADTELFQTHLLAADAAVQLRGTSRGETSGAVLDCLAFGIPTVINTKGSVIDYPESLFIRIEGDFSDDELARAIESLHDDMNGRKRLSVAGRDWVQNQHDPEKIAKQYRDAIEHFATHPQHPIYWRLLQAIANLPGQPTTDDEIRLARAIAATLPAWTRHPP